MVAVTGSVFLIFAMVAPALIAAIAQSEPSMNAKCAAFPCARNVLKSMKQVAKRLSRANVTAAKR